MHKAAQNPLELLEFRRQIDALDDRIIDLLTQRTNIVRNVGKYKHENFPGICPIRAAREADMVKRIVEKFKDSSFPPAAAAAIWRTIIGASTSVEGALAISAYAPDKQNDLYWMAREYFGPFLPVTKQPYIKRVIGDVMDGKAAVGIVPMPSSNDNESWWLSLIQTSDDSPKIFAHIPFVHFAAVARDTPVALAIARIKPEETDNDVSIFVIEADGNLSQNKLQSAFVSAKLETSWVNITTVNAASRHHLIEIKGFITPDHEKILSVTKELGSAVMNLYCLGAYAQPITIDS